MARATAPGASASPVRPRWARARDVRRGPFGLRLPRNDCIAQPVVIVLIGVVDGEVQAAALLAAGGALDDQPGHIGDIAQLDDVAGDLEAPIVLADLLAEEIE